MKRFTFLTTALSAALFILPVAAIPSFRGEAGVLAEVKNNGSENFFPASFNAQAFLTGQLDFSGKFILRASLRVRANDIFSWYRNFSPTSRNAQFTPEEISATYRIAGEKTSHYISAYVGNFEPLGSDLFLRHHFGLPPLASSFTQSYRGLAGVQYFPLYGIGLGYVIHPTESLAAGINIYRNIAQDEDNAQAWNADLRVAGVWRAGAIDFAAGITFPADFSESDAIILAEEIQLHGSIIALLGNRYTSSLFLQAGINSFVFRKNQSEGFDSLLPRDVYGMLELRARAGHATVDMGAFMFPARCADDMVFLSNIVTKVNSTENIFGIKANVRADNVWLGRARAAFGMHATLTLSVAGTSSAEFTFSDMVSAFSSFSRDQIGLTLFPYASFTIPGGTLSAAIGVDVFDIMFSDSTTDCYTASVSFRTGI